MIAVISTSAPPLTRRCAHAGTRQVEFGRNDEIFGGEQRTFRKFHRPSSNTINIIHRNTISDFSSWPREATLYVSETLNNFENDGIGWPRPRL
jgi:hypothetical protein